MDLLCFGKELEVQEMPGRLLHVWAGFRSRQGFPGHDKVLLVMCRDMGPLCHDMSFRLVAVARSQQCFLLCLDNVTTEMVMTRD